MELRNGQAGNYLVDATLHYARIHNLRIIPRSRFAKAVLYKKPEQQDALQQAD